MSETNALVTTGMGESAPAACWPDAKREADKMTALAAPPLAGRNERCPIAEKVAAQVLSRAEKGFRKYGVTCARQDLSLADWLQHLQEELLDAAVYVETLKASVERSGPANS